MKITTTRTTDPTGSTTTSSQGVVDVFGKETEIFNVTITETKIVDDNGTSTTTTITSNIDYVDELNKILELIR